VHEGIDPDWHDARLRITHQVAVVILRDPLAFPLRAGGEAKGNRGWVHALTELRQPGVQTGGFGRAAE
jgi:hypothetical protein